MGGLIPRSNPLHPSHSTAVWSTDYPVACLGSSTPLGLTTTMSFLIGTAGSDCHAPEEPRADTHIKVIRSTNGSRKGKIPGPGTRPRNPDVNVFAGGIMSRTIQLCVSVCSVRSRILCEPESRGNVAPSLSAPYFCGCDTFPIV